jgi:hypothetical protein
MELVDLEYKICKGKNGCGKTKSVTDFHLNQSMCRPCKKEYSRKRRSQPEVIEKEKAYKAEWNLKNPNYFKEYNDARKNDPEYRIAVNKATSAWKKNNPHKVSEQWHKRRAAKYNVAYEKIDRSLVFERDNWICQLCFEPVNETLEWPHKESKSLDHIIPLVLNGPHMYSNVQLTHLNCNLKKWMNI